MQKRDRTIDDKFPMDDVQIARREAKNKLDIDYDSKFEVLFDTYVSYTYQPNIRQQCANEISKMFSEMIKLGYTPLCVRFYQTIWDALQEAHEQ